MKIVTLISINYSKEGKEKRRHIKSIAPVVNQINEMGEITGESEIYWFDYEELQSILKKPYFSNKDGKLELYTNYLANRVL